MSSLSAVLDVLRPGRVQAREAVDRIRHDVRELKSTVRALEEKGRKEDERVERALTEALTSVSARLEELTRELRGINDRLGVLGTRESQLRAILTRDAELEDAAGELGRLLTAPGISEHIAAAIAGATLHLDPCPFTVVDNLLPDALYDALITGLPPSELFADKPVNKQQLKVPFDFAPAYSRRVWRFMADVVVPQFITPAVVEKFRAPLTEWIRENWPVFGDDPLATGVKLHSTDGRIMLRRRGYRIPPHRDPKWGFLTCLVYLVRPDDAESWGTQLYSVDGDREARGAAPHWIDASSCNLAHDVANRRNRALIFLNSVGAHGASIPADAEPADLERYLYQFRIGPTGAAMASMMAGLADERRPMWAGKAFDY